MAHKIDIKTINIYQMVKIVSIVTTTILSVIITLISVFFDSTIIIMIFGTLISLIVAIICYRIIGKLITKGLSLKLKLNPFFMTFN